MRALLGGLLTFVSFVVALAEPNGRNAALAAPGDQIKEFLENMQTNRVEVELIRLDVTKGAPTIDAAGPDSMYIAANTPRTGILGSGCYENLARSQLKRALDKVGPLPQNPPPFRPDYCLVAYDTARHPTSVLWIDSAISSLQMEFRSSAGDDSARSRIDVRVRLQQIFEFVTGTHTQACNEICTLLDAIEDRRMQFDVMSVDPKSIGRVVGQPQKPWVMIGKVTINDQRRREDIVDALTGAMTPQPKVTSFFTPHLAVSVTILTATSAGCGTLEPGVYVLLMSFECRKMQLWKLQRTQPPWPPELPINNAGADQILNNILVKAGQALKLESTPSSD